MFTIMRKIEIDAGHRVPFHTSKCKSLHGHRYTVEISLSSKAVIDSDGGDSEAGMLMDFGIVKEILMDVIHNPYDHSLILWERDPLILQSSLLEILTEFSQKVILVPCIPTAEELAKLWGEAFKTEFEQRAKPAHGEIGLEPTSMLVWETPNAWAAYDFPE